jgi:hypothetical protein
MFELRNIPLDVQFPYFESRNDQFTDRQKKSKLANEKGRKTALAIKPTAQQTHF